MNPLFIALSVGLILLIGFVVWSRRKKSSPSQQHPTKIRPQSVQVEKQTTSRNQLPVIKQCQTREGDVFLLSDGTFSFTSANRSTTIGNVGVYEEQGVTIGGYLMNEKIRVARYRKECQMLILENAIGMAFLSYKDASLPYIEDYIERNETDWLHFMHRMNQQKQFIRSEDVATLQYIFTKDIPYDMKTLEWHPVTVQKELETFYLEQPKAKQLVANIQTFIQGQEGRVGIQVFSEQSRLKDTSTSAIRTLTQQMWNKTLDKDLKRIKDLKNH